MDDRIGGREAPGAINFLHQLSIPYSEFDTNELVSLRVAVSFLTKWKFFAK
jgi:hypothetical protein